MQQFVVPQFIYVENKILGPVTVRQFLILLVGAGIIFLAYHFGDFALFIFFAVLVGALSLIFAFLKINGQTFHYFLLNIIQTLRKPSLRIWNKHYSNKELNRLRKIGFGEEVAEVLQRKQAKRKRIKDLALVVNTGGYYRGEEDTI